MLLQNFKNDKIHYFYLNRNIINEIFFNLNYKLLILVKNNNYLYFIY